MAKLKMIVELEYDEDCMHSGNEDKEAKDWFFCDILLTEELILHSNEIGDSIGFVKVLKIDEMETAVKDGE